MKTYNALILLTVNNHIFTVTNCIAEDAKT